MRVGRSEVAGWRERVGNGNDNEAGREKIRRWSRIPRDSSRVSVRCTCRYLLVAGALVLVSPWLSIVYGDTEYARTLTQPRERTMRALRHP